MADEVGLPGANLAGALAWFADNKQKVTDVLDWFEANKTTLQNVLANVDKILSLFGGMRDGTS